MTPSTSSSPPPSATRALACVVAAALLCSGLAGVAAGGVSSAGTLSESDRGPDEAVGADERLLALPLDETVDDATAETENGTESVTSANETADDGAETDESEPIDAELEDGATADAETAESDGEETGSETVDETDAAQTGTTDTSDELSDEDASDEADTEIDAERDGTQLLSNATESADEDEIDPTESGDELDATKVTEDPDATKTTDAVVTATTTDSSETGTTITDPLANATDETTSTAADAADNATTAVESPAELLPGDDRGAVPQATDGLEPSVDESVAPAESVGAAPDRGSLAAMAGTEATPAADSNETAAEPDGEASEPDETGGSSSPPGSSAGTDAVLVGLLGAIAASGAAGNAGAGLGAGIGAGMGAGASSSTAGTTGLLTTAGNMIAHWLNQIGLLRRARRLASLIPLELASIFRYSRYDDSDPLENDRRRTVYETIRNDPGCYLSQVSDRSGVTLSTVRHHLRVLEEEGLIASAKIGGKRRFYLEVDDGGERAAADREDDEDAAAAENEIGAETVELQAALSEPAKRDVLEALASIGRANNGRLADALDRDPSTVSHHLSSLESDGLIVRDRDGRAVVNRLAPDVEAALVESVASESDDPDRPTLSPADD